MKDETIHWTSAIAGVGIVTAGIWALKYLDPDLELGVTISSWLAAFINFVWWGGREWWQARKKYNEWVQPDDWSEQKQIEFVYPTVSGTLTAVVITLIDMAGTIKTITGV